MSMSKEKALPPQRPVPNEEATRSYPRGAEAEGIVTSSTENQAFHAILFLYRKVLNLSPEGEAVDAVRAQKKRNIPVLLAKDEVKKIITLMTGPCQLLARLLYGSGLQ
jgi:hypothetical protein